MVDQKVKVLYISGWGRSGSTILSNILGQVEGLFPVGEIRFIWERNLLENRLCGCSNPFLDCTLWQQIFEEAFGGFGRVGAQRMIDLCENFSRTRHVPKFLLSRDRIKTSPEVVEYLDHVERLYKAIQSVTGCRVIIDSSKYPSYAALLDLIPSLDLRVVHMVRDPRAVSYSWSKLKEQPDTQDREYMIQFTPIQSSMIWNIWNILTELYWKRKPNKYLFLCYEKFVAFPEQSVERILRLLNEDVISLPFLEGNKIQIDPIHTLSGNPVRFNQGVLSLKLDEEWRKKSTRRDNLITTLLTWPLLIKYQNSCISIR